MAEQSKDKSAPEVAASATAGPTAAGRLQAGEQVSNLSNRPPRGVGEPAADEVAEGELGQVQKAVHDQVATESERGFRGQQVDATPNEHYTVAGVTAGKPTPETNIVTPGGWRR